LITAMTAPCSGRSENVVPAPAAARGQLQRRHVHPGHDQHKRMRADPAPQSGEPRDLIQVVLLARHRDPERFDRLLLLGPRRADDRHGGDPEDEDEDGPSTHPAVPPLDRPPSRAEPADSWQRPP
jgi:hypothetical protein